MESGALKMPPRVLPSSWNFSMRTFVSGCVADFAVTLLVIRTLPENLFAVAESKGSSRYRLPGQDTIHAESAAECPIWFLALRRPVIIAILFFGQLETDAKRPAKYGEALALSGQRGLPIDSESDIT